MIKRLRKNIICIIMLITAVILAVFFGMILHFIKEDIQARSIQVLESLSVDIPKPDGRDMMLENGPVPHIIAELNHQGKLISSKSFLIENSEEGFVERIVYETTASEKRTGILRAYKLRYLKTTTPFGMRIIFGDISSEYRIMTNLLRNCILNYSISMLIFLGVSILLSRWIIRPVETAWNQQRQFVADASHELKTPLTVILTNVELLQNESYSLEESRRFVASIQSMSHQMRGLVEGLLDLARVDNGSVKMVFSDLIFDELISDELLPFEPLFFEKELEISSQLEPNVRVYGSETHLRQMMNILLDNACKYSLTPGVVKIELKIQGSHCLLSVSNPYEELSGKELKNIFRRFYRMDKARSMNHSYGLGLAIAEALVREHGGKIWAESRDGNISFFVQLPLHHSVNSFKR